METEVTEEHVILSFKIKRMIQSLRRYAWDMRQLLQELRQNQSVTPLSPLPPAIVCFRPHVICLLPWHVTPAVAGWGGTGAGGDNGIAKMWNRREISVSSYYDQSHSLHPHP
eukprot:COSAG01_NODE_798_length_13503_cov_8.878395_14_plen_112_part_00